MAVTFAFAADDYPSHASSDNSIMTLQGVPDKVTPYSYVNRFITTDTLLQGRSVYRISHSNGYPSVWNGGFVFHSDDVFGPHAELKTRWTLGFRLRFNELGQRTLTNGAPLIIASTESNDINLSVFSSSEILAKCIRDRYSYFEATIDFEAMKVRRWIDGYELPALELTNELASLDVLAFYITTAADNSNNSYWTDFYFMVDTQDDTPCKRLGGVQVHRLNIAEAPLADGWSVSDTEKTSDVIVSDAPRSLSDITPYVESSVAENPMRFLFGEPTLSRGKILFVQTFLNAYRKNGSDATLYSTVIQGEKSEAEREHTMNVDDIQGRLTGRFNVDLNGVPWTPELVTQLGIDILTRSGGGQ